MNGIVGTNNYLSMLNSQPSPYIACVTVEAKNRFEGIDCRSICSISNGMYVHLKPSIIPLFRSVGVGEDIGSGYTSATTVFSSVSFINIVPLVSGLSVY